MGPWLTRRPHSPFLAAQKTAAKPAEPRPTTMRSESAFPSEPGGFGEGQSGLVPLFPLMGELALHRPPQQGQHLPPGGAFPEHEQTHPKQAHAHPETHGHAQDHGPKTQQDVPPG